MRGIFLDAALNDSFRKNGYIILDLFDSRTCIRLVEEYEQNHPAQHTENFFTSTYSPDPIYRKQCNEVITHYLSSYMQKVLDNYLPLFGNFMAKPAGDNSECRLHQDWSFVDESSFRSVNLWIALQDTDITNGCIHVVPGSHNLPLPVRGRNIATVYSDALSSITGDLAIPVPLKMGQCIIFDSAIFHYSPANTSGKLRIAASLIFYPAEALLMHYVYDKINPERVVKYNVDAEFFVKFGSAEDYFSPEGEATTINHQRLTFDSIKVILAEQQAK